MMSLDHQLPRIESIDLADPGRDRADAYGRLFGWPVKWRGPHPYLVLENGICAATLPRLSARPALTRLAAAGCKGPALTLPTQRGPRVAVLAENYSLLPPRDALPRDVEVLAWGTLLPLPITSRHTEARSEWLTAPDTNRRWLPSLEAVLSSIDR